MRSDAIVHFEGRLVPASEANIGILAPAVTRGPIVYETLRAYWNDEEKTLFVFRPGDHARRLRASMRTLRFRDLVEPADLEERILATLRANALHEDVHLRVFAYPLDQGSLGRAVLRTGIVITAEPRPAKMPKPVSCQVSSWRRGGDDAQPSRVKALGIRMFARVAMIQATEEGYDQIILLNERGKVAEGVSSNIFLVRDGTLITPPGTASVLLGITRATIMTMAAGLGLPCHEREIDRSELYDCDEAFLCSTGLEILPITSVDRLTVGDGTPGPVTGQVAHHYAAIVRGGVPDDHHWRKAV